jgi:hypothetical protein
VRRDPDIILSILEEITESDYAHINAKLALARGPLKMGAETERGRQSQIRDEHIRWMLDDGLLVPIAGTYVRITAAGCELYENAQVQGAWQEAKRVAIEQGGTIAFEFFKDVVKSFASKQLKKYIDLTI